MGRRPLNVMKWKDISDGSSKKAAVTFLNGISVVISQRLDIDLSEDHLFHVIVLDKKMKPVCDYLDESDVYSDEPNLDFSSWMTVDQIEYYLQKISKMIL